jgi:hypothetical protein
MNSKWYCFKITNLDALVMIYKNGPTNARGKWSFVTCLTIGELYFAKAKLLDEYENEFGELWYLSDMINT